MIAETCFSIALILMPLEKGPIFIFWTAYAGAADLLNKHRSIPAKWL
jgi:hypothetical protein